MKYRDHRGGFDESMATTVELADFDALYSHCRKALAPYHFAFAKECLHVEPYSGIDQRNGWDTHVVTVDGYGVMGFTDGPAPLVAKHVIPELPPPTAEEIEDWADGVVYHQAADKAYSSIWLTHRGAFPSAEVMAAMIAPSRKI